VTVAHAGSAVHGFGGVVSAGGPLAASAGLAALVDGGNAVDAVIAAAFVQCVVEAPWGGIGGDAFVLVRTPSGEVLALNGSGAAPMKLAAQIGDGELIPRFGPMSVAVPGFVGAVTALHERGGSRPFGDLAAPSIGYATDGFPVTPALRDAIDRVLPELAADAPLRRLLESNGTTVGSRFRLPRLADTLRLVVEGGAAAFYAEAGESISRSLRERGGALTPDDLAAHESRWSSPLSASYGDVEVHTHAPVSLGCLLLQQLGLYERLDLPYRPPADPARIDAMVRCKHVAFSHTLPHLQYATDETAAVAELLAVNRLDALADRLLDAPVATLSSPVELPDGPDTTCVVAADGDGWMAAIIHSLFNEFGSRELDAATGVLLNDRLANQRHAVNGVGGIAPGGRPLHTLNAVLVSEPDGSATMWATPGGRGQVQTSFQVVVNAFDGKVEPQRAIGEPRWLSGAPRRPEPDDQLYLEPGIPAEAAAELERRGHRVAITDGASSDLYGSCALVGRNADGALLGAADHRRQACAAAL